MDKYKLIIILILLCFTILIISNIADAKKYDRVKICGKWYTLGEADNVCPDYYFPEDAGVYNASNGTDTDPDCFYVNITADNTSDPGSGYSNWSLITFPQKVNKKISKGRLGTLLADQGIDQIAYCNSTGCVAVAYINVTYNYTIDSWSTDFTEINPEYSYWVRSSNDLNLKVPYTWEQNHTVELNEGDNMVGWYSNESKSVADSLNGTDCEGKLMLIHRWNTTTQWYNTAYYNGSEVIQVTEFTTFEPGYGYWFQLYAGYSCNWTYEP